MTEPDFLTLEDVLEIHADQLATFGGAEGIRSQHGLESAIGVPQASFGGEYLHADLFEMAAAYAFHLAENQPFLDGNKRTGLVSALLFLEFNDVVLLDPLGLLYQAMIDLSSRALDKTGLADLFRGLPRE